MIHWYERVAASLRDRGVKNAEVGRNMTPKVTGQAITLKLQGKRPVTVEELKVFARLAGLTVAEALGDDVIVELADEKELVELFRLLTDAQKQAFLAMLKASFGDKTGGSNVNPWKIIGWIVLGFIVLFWGFAA